MRATLPRHVLLREGLTPFSRGSTMSAELNLCRSTHGPVEDLEDGAAGGYFYGGHAAAEQDEQAAAVRGSQRTAVLGKGRDYGLDQVGLVDDVGIFVHDVEVVTAAEPYP